MSTRNSPRSQKRAEVDTTLPYQNVKAAVRMFGEKVESRPAYKNNEKNIQNQSGIQQLQEELTDAKSKLADAEKDKARALAEVDELRQQLQVLSTAMRSDDMNQTQSMVGSHAYLENELKKEREEHRSTLAALQICKDELNKLENEMAVMLKEKESAVRQVDEALTAAEVNARRAEELSNEISGTKESLVLMKMAYVEVNKEKEALIAARKAQNNEQERCSKELNTKASPAEDPSTHSNGESNGDDWKMLRNNLLAAKRSLVNISRLKVKDASLFSELETAKARLSKAIDNEASVQLILKEFQEKLNDMTKELNLTKSQLSDQRDKENRTRSESKLLLSELQRMKAELKSAVSCNEAIIGLHQKLQEMDVTDTAGPVVNALSCNDNDVVKAELQAMLDEEVAALRRKSLQLAKLDDGNMQNATTDNQQTSCDDGDSTTGSSTTQQQDSSTISVSKDEATGTSTMEEESIANMVTDQYKKKKKTTLSSLGSFLSRKKSQKMNST